MTREAAHPRIPEKISGVLLVLSGAALSSVVGRIAWSFSAGILVPTRTHWQRLTSFFTLLWPEVPIGILLIVVGIALYLGERKNA
jgi:hypothetical protein